MTPEGKAREIIDAKLEQSGWSVQDISNFSLSTSLGVVLREYPTSTGPVDYALFVDGTLVGVIKAKRDSMGENMTAVETQSNRYANSVFKYVFGKPHIWFVYEATGELTKFTDFNDIKPYPRSVFSFHRPETLLTLMQKKDTIRNNMKHFPPLDTRGFWKCQIEAIQGLDRSFADNRPKALVQMATGSGKTFTAITAAYRLLSYGKMRRILFLVDTKSLGEQAENEFWAYRPNDDHRAFPEIFSVCRLKKSYIPEDVHICISTIQRMYSILKGEELDESAEEESMFELDGANSQSVKEVVYNRKYPPEFFDCIIVDECHRSIYNVWSQVLEYFGSFIIGLTATPGSRTIGFFNQNMVSECTREQAIIDGVNVGEDIFYIETEITKNGAHIMKQLIEHRDRLSRKKRWKELDDDIDYAPTQLDARLSRDDGDKAESNSIVSQKALCEDYIQNHPDLGLVKIYVDDGWSGVDHDRPNFRLLEQDIRDGKIDCVVCKDLSRFSRNYIEAGWYLEKIFPQMGVRFIAINDGYDSLTGNRQSDSIIIPFKNLINDTYCRDISVKI